MSVPDADLSDLDLLRETAAQMRERAQAASDGPWEVLDSIHRDPYVVQKGRGILTGGCIALASGEDYGKGNSEHIASWHPLVALPVADWLDEVADGWSWNPHPIGTERHALRVAHAFRGDQPNDKESRAR